MIIFLILFFIIAISIFFFVSLQKLSRNVAIKYEEINKLKSNVRLVKAKYVQSFKKSNDKLEKYKDYDGHSTQNSKSFTFSSTYLNLNDGHSQSERYVDQLATQLFSAQKILNDKIESYNAYLSNHAIFTSLKKIKKLDYIDSENLEKSLILTDIDSFDI